MSRRLLVAVITLFAIPITGRTVPASGQQPIVATCTIQKETATGNSRSEVAYYECRSVNGAVIPSVTFLVVTDAPGELWLRQLEGRTVDVRLDVVR